MRYHVRHTTAYRYSEPVSLCHYQARLAPPSGRGQQCERFRLSVDPLPVYLATWRDYFRNQVHYFTLEDPHPELTVTAESTVTVHLPEAPPPDGTPPWEAVRERLAAARDTETLAAAQFAFESPSIRWLAEAADYAAVSFTAGRPLLAAALDLTDRIHREFKYLPASTSVNTTTAEVFRARRGVCQDFAHLQITCLRSIGLAARYVSGYLLTEPPPGRPRLIGADASHAWLAVYCPGSGWLDLDPTNNQMPRQRHVTVACGRDYNDVCPIKGIFLGGGQQAMRVSVDVTPAAESERAGG